MKIQARKNIFETNSSSVHSIVVGNNGEDIYANLPKRLHFGGEEFGWEYAVYRGREQKANYLFTSLIYTDTPLEYVKRIKKILAKWKIKATFDEIVEKGSYLNCEGEKVIYYGITSKFSDDAGYVDHGDNNRDLVKELCEDEVKLMNYLFSDASYVQTDNDNEMYYEDVTLDEPKNLLLEYRKGN